MLSLFGGTVASLWAASCSSGTLAERDGDKVAATAHSGEEGDGEAGRVGELEPASSRLVGSSLGSGWRRASASRRSRRT